MLSNVDPWNMHGMLLFGPQHHYHHPFLWVYRTGSQLKIKSIFPLRPLKISQKSFSCTQSYLMNVTTSENSENIPTISSVFLVKSFAKVKRLKTHTTTIVDSIPQYSTGVYLYLFNLAS